MHYLTIQAAPMRILDKDDASVVTSEVTAAQAFATMFQDFPFVQKLGTFNAYDLRAKLIAAKPGDVVELRDDEHSVLAEVATKPTAGLWNPAFLNSPDGIEFLRSIVKAPTTKPPTEPVEKTG